MAADSRAKKKRLNARRGKQAADSPSNAVSDAASNAEVASVVSAPLQAAPDVATLPAIHAVPARPATPGLAIQLPGLELTDAIVEQSPVLDYVLLLFWLLARRRLNPEELLDRLRERMRQHSLVHLGRRDYVDHFVSEQPP